MDPTGKVDLKAVQEAHSAVGHYGCNRSMVVANREFTSSARVLAMTTGTMLVDREELGKWILQAQKRQLA